MQRLNRGVTGAVPEAFLLNFQFINRLSEAVPLGERGEEGFAFPEDTKALQRHLCVHQLSRALGLQHALDAEGKLLLIAELKAHYRHGLKFGENIRPAAATFVMVSALL